MFISLDTGYAALVWIWHSNHSIRNGKFELQRIQTGLHMKTVSKRNKNLESKTEYEINISFHVNI